MYTHHIQSQQRYYMCPPHMIQCIIPVHMKQHRQRKIYHQRKIHWYAFAFTLAKYAITHTDESRANLLCSVYPHFQKHFHRCWCFSWFLCSVTLRGIRDIQILIHAHACLYTIHFFYTPICTHTCMCSHTHAYVHTHAQYTLGSCLNSPLWQDSI